jgi:PKD repeat protein
MDPHARAAHACHASAILGFATVVLLLTGPALAQTEVRTSTFDANLEGWHCLDPGECEHRTSGGNPGGYVRVNHRAFGDFSNISICGPNQPPGSLLFTGDLSAFEGGTVLFDVIVFGPALPPGHFGELNIFNTEFPAVGITVHPVTGVAPTGWTTYSLPLGPGPWFKLPSGQEPADAAHIARTLSDVECMIVDTGVPLNFWETGLELIHTGFDNFTIIGYPDPANADFTWSPDLPEPGFPVEFIDLSTGDGLTYWAWDFDGDGITDSTAPNPTRTFAMAGDYDVTLTVTNSVRSSSKTKRLVIPGSGVAVTQTDWQYDGFFLQGTDVTNELDADVAWQGSPGVVTFSINGGPPAEETGDAEGAAHTFDLGADFIPDFAPSVVTLVPANGESVTGPPWTEKVYVFPFPRWLTLALETSTDAVTFTAGGGEIKTEVKADFPKKHLCRPGGPPCKFTVPTFVPYLAGEWGMEETYARVQGTLSSKGTGTIGLEGQTGIKVKNQILAGTVNGDGTWTIGPPDGFEFDSATFKLKLKGTVREELGVIEAIPALGVYAGLPVVRWFNERAKIVGDISPVVDLTTTIKQENGDLRFDDFTDEVGIELKATVKVDVVPDRVTAEAWVSGGGSLTIGVPEPLLREVQLNIEAGAEYEADAIFIVREGEFRCRATCKWTPSSGITCPIDCDAEGGREVTGATITLREPDYEAYGTQARRIDLEIPDFRGPTDLPPPVEESVLFSNVFAGASPEIAHAANGVLLLWEYQDTADPVVQSSDIAWSWFDFSSWSAMSLVANDTRMELSPVAGVDGSGRVVAAWLRIKDPAFTTPITTEEDLPLFYNELEVVTAVFNTSTQTWGPVTALTNDAVLDTDLRLASDASGNLLLTWIENPGGEFISTATNPATLMYSRWNSGTASWSAPAAVASGLVGAVRHTSAVRGSQALIVLSRDPNPALEDDGELVLYTWNGTAWSAASTFAAGGVENRSPAAAYDASGAGHVVWLRDGDLVHAKVSAPTPVVIRPGSDAMGLQDIELVADGSGNVLTALWRVAADNRPSDIFAMNFDRQAQAWGVEMQLTDDDLRDDDLSAVYDPVNLLYVAYLSTVVDRVSQVVDIEGQPATLTNIPQDGQVDLRLLRNTLSRDLAIAPADVRVDPLYPVAGVSVSVDVTVHNIGELTAGSFDVALYVGHPNVGGTLVDSGQVTGPLVSGDERSVALSFVLPSPVDDLYVLIDTADVVNEQSESNNQAVYRIANSLPNPVLMADATSGAPPLTVHFDGRASTDPDSDTLSFGWSFGDGNASATGGTVSHTFDRPGDFPVTLAATDARGLTASTTVMVRLAGGAGAVPDGNVLSGEPLRLGKDAGGELLLSWSVSPCGLGDTGYAIYEGVLGGDFTSHVPVTCNVAGGIGTTSAAITPSASDAYYLVVPHNAAWEGSYGRRSGGYERPPSSAACFPQGIGTCEPCGNGALDADAGEPCDGANLSGTTCQSLGFDGGTLGCNSTCSEFSTLGCYHTVCGNGVIEGGAGEVCDGSNLGAATCATAGFDSGLLACNATCDGFDTTNCHDCGNGACEPVNGEDCLSCPADCNGVQGGNPANRYCCGDGAGTNPVGCGDPRCTGGGNTCLDCIVGPSLPTNGLVLRLETDTGLLTASGTTVVTGWQDSSGEGNHLTAFGAPTVTTAALNGRDIVTFDGADDHLERTAALSGLPLGASDRSVFQVVRYRSNGFGGWAYGSLLCDQAFGLVVDPVGNLALQGWCTDFPAPAAGNGAGWLVQSAVLGPGGTGRSFRHFKNGDLIGSGTHPSPAGFNTGGARLVLGAELDRSPHIQMDVAAVLVYDRALNELERQEVESYLEEKYLGVGCP